MMSFMPFFHSQKRLRYDCVSFIRWCRCTVSINMNLNSLWGWSRASMHS